MKRIGPSWTSNSAPASASRPYRGRPHGCGACVLVKTCAGLTSSTSTTAWSTASRSGCPPAARWARRGYSTRCTAGPYRSTTNGNSGMSRS